MSDFDLRALVRDVLDTSQSPDPTVVSAEVLARIDQSDYAAALVQCMRPYVRQMIVSQRMRRTDPDTIEPEAEPTPAPRQRIGTPFHQRGNYSTTWRDHLLASREYDPITKQHLFLGDATIQNLLNMAAYRDEMADANRGKAQQLRRLADVMRERGCLRVRDLSDDALTHLTQKAA